MLGKTTWQTIPEIELKYIFTNKNLASVTLSGLSKIKRHHHYQNEELMNNFDMMNLNGNIKSAKEWIVLIVMTLSFGMPMHWKFISQTLKLHADKIITNFIKNTYTEVSINLKKRKKKNCTTPY